MIKVDGWPARSMWEVSDRVNKIPYSIKVVSLVGLNESHGANKICIVKVVPEQSNCIVVGAMSRDGGRKQVGRELRLSKVANQA